MDRDPVCTKEAITIRVHNDSAEPMELPGDIGFTALVKKTGTDTCCYPVGSGIKGPDPAVIVEPKSHHDIEISISRAAECFCYSLCLGSPGLTVLSVDLEIYQATIDKPVELHWEGPALCPAKPKLDTDIDAV